MKTYLRIAILLLLPGVSLPTQTSVAGEWIATLHNQFGPGTLRMSLTVSGDQVSGNIGTRKFTGTILGSALELKADNQAVKATLDADELKGEDPRRLHTRSRIQP